MTDPVSPQGGLPLVEIVGLTKRFPGVLASDDVNLAIFSGEIHVVLGENGAGKSTLVGMLSGLLQPDRGEIRIDGAARTIASPRRALDLGIGTVFQHVMLVPSLTVAENLALGGAWWRWPDRAALGGRIRHMSASLGLAIDPNEIAGGLSLGEQQQVEIVRALLRGSRVLILDESTSMLTPKGAADLGALMRRLAARDMAIVFITHKLHEAFAFGDRISVLRLGRKVGEIAPEEKVSLGEAETTARILRLMFGAPAPPAVAAEDRGTKGPVRRPRTILDVSDLVLGEDTPGHGGIDLSVAEGEILGIAGIDGSGQKQLAEILAGQRRSPRGRIRLDRQALETLGVGARRALGLRYVTDDRLGEGTVGAFSVAINLVLKEIGKAPFWTRGWERKRRLAAHARALVDAFDIRTPALDTPIGRLSGGNIQKALLARELSGPAKLVIYAKPTHGLDVRTTVTMRRRIRETADRGVATVLISTDLEELLELSDRIAVMSGTRLVGTLANGDGAREKIGALMVGSAS